MQAQTDKGITARQRRAQRECEEQRRRWEENVERELKRMKIALRLKRKPRNFLLPDTEPNKVGRNDPCPCGSGKKYKKCCLLLEREAPPKVQLGYGHYASPGYLSACDGLDPILALENLNALAEEAAERGDVDQALAIYSKMEPLATQVDMLANLLQDWQLFCQNNQRFEEALALARRLAELYEAKGDSEQAASYHADAADCLAELGRLQEAEQLYLDTLERVGYEGWPLLRYADYLSDYSSVAEATKYYLSLLEREETWDIVIAVKERLEDLLERRRDELPEELIKAVEQAKDQG